ncbi:MAG TPA: hypothetical protein VHO25_10020 [Polyangiaceae bacterium]|nr:hypothetical protein [Polyangiaceae bacterium]
MKEKIRTWWEDRHKVGSALQEIRDQKLYQHEHDTFEEFCQEEYGFERAHAYRLIGFAEVKASIQMSPMGDKITNERQARALAPVPEEKRVEVLEEVAEKGTVTAKAITEVAERVTAKSAEPKAKEQKQNHLDKTGYPIPEAILADWQKAEAFRSILSQLQTIKLLVEKSVENSELLFAEIGQDTVADLKNAWTTLKQLLPYAVCPSCQGRTRAKCSACKRRGFVSEFGYKHWFAKEVIELRERAIKQ